MRKITEKVTRAFRNREGIKINNSETRVYANGDVLLFLHGNPIAMLKPSGELRITTCGWDTPTTKDRLNALPNVHVFTRKGVMYLNDEEWDGGLVIVKHDKTWEYLNASKKD